MKTFFILVFLTVSLPSFAKKISSVRFEGNVQFSSRSLLNMIQSKKNKEFSEVRAQKDLKRLYRTGLFEKIELKKSLNSRGLWDLKFKVKESLRIVKFHFEGNKSFSDKKLSKILEDLNIKTWTNKNFYKALEAIKDRYQEKSYFFVKLKFKTKNLNTFNSQAFVQIQEGPKLSIKKVNFHGMSQISKLTARRIFQTTAKNILSPLTGAGIYIESTLKKDVEHLQFTI